MRRLPISIALVAALAGQFALAAPLDAASPYLLPVPAGTTVLVYQGNNSAYDHTAANGSQYAWDFTVGATEFPVVAARGGTVIGARSDSTNTKCYSMACWTDANYVLIDHGADKTSALYLHLKTGSVAVKVGQTVAQGTFLGNADSTGFSYGTHLHFMVETTPTSRSGSSWWWTQSLGITFADAGLPLVDQSYTSQNAGQPAPTPTPTPIAFQAPTSSEWKTLVDRPHHYTGNKDLALWACVLDPTGYLGPNNFDAIAYPSRSSQIGKIGTYMAFDGDTQVLGDLPIKTLVFMQVHFEFADNFNTTPRVSIPDGFAQFTVLALERKGTCNPYSN